MALIKCINCGQMVSEKALKCPKCGTPIQKKETVTNTSIKDKEKPFNKPQQRAQELPKEEVFVSASGKVYNVNGTKDKSNKSNNSVLLVVIVLFVTLVIGIVAFLIYQNGIFDEWVKKDVQSEQTAYKSVLITGSDVRLRLGASTSYESLQYEDGANVHPKAGDNLEYLGEQYDFYKVKYKGNVVYVSKIFSSLSHAEPHTQPLTLVVISGERVLMYTGPGLHYPTATDYFGRDIVLKTWSTYKYVAEQGDFYKIDYGGLYYYVSKYDSHLD